MFHVITIRREGDKTAYGHIAAGRTDRVFCGLAIPIPVLEMWDDPRNPYQNKINVSCVVCVSEWNNGRRAGYRTTQDLIDPEVIYEEQDTAHSDV